MKFCPRCGAHLENENQQLCSKCAMNENPQGTQQPYQGGNNYPGGFPTNAPKAPSMKWFKFLIYFGLFAGALLNFVNGVRYITGNIYLSQVNGITVTPEMVYALHGNGLKMVDVIFGLALIAFAGFGIFVRFRLAAFKADGPTYLCIMYAFIGGITLIYNIALFAATGVNQIFSTESAISIIMAGVMIGLNNVYFNKRKFLFVK